MKRVKLNNEEQEIQRAIESGQVKSVKNFKKKKLVYQQVATATLTKNKNVNIRLSEKDLLKIKPLRLRKAFLTKPCSLH